MFLPFSTFICPFAFVIPNYAGCKTPLNVCFFSQVYSSALRLVRSMVSYFMNKPLDLLYFDCCLLLFNLCFACKIVVSNWSIIHSNNSMIACIAAATTTISQGWISDCTSSGNCSCTTWWLEKVAFHLKSGRSSAGILYTHRDHRHMCILA